MISSAKIKHYHSLLQKKYRRKEGKFLIEGTNLCKAALQYNADLEIVLVSNKVAESPAIAALIKSATSQSVQVEIVMDKIVIRLSESVEPQGIVAVVTMAGFSMGSFQNTSAKEVVILDRVRDPGNLGTILRTADWFGVKAIGLTSTCVDVHNGKVLRSSAGSYFSLQVVQPDLELIETVKGFVERGYEIIVTTPLRSQAYFDVDFKRPFVLILGSERQGVDPRIEAISHQKAHIPKRGNSESLNVAVSAGIILSEAVRRYH